MARAQALRGSFLMPTPSLRSSWRNLSDMTPMNGFSQGRLSRTPEGGTKLRHQGLHHVHIMCISSAFRAEGFPLWQLLLQESITLALPSMIPRSRSVGWISRTLTSEISEKQKRTGESQTDGLANQLMWITPQIMKWLGNFHPWDHSRGIH